MSTKEFPKINLGGAFDTDKYKSIKVTKESYDFIKDNFTSISFGVDELIRFYKEKGVK